MILTRHSTFYPTPQNHVLFFLFKSIQFATWNSLPLAVRGCQTGTALSRLLRDHFFKNANAISQTRLCHVNNVGNVLYYILHMLFQYVLYSLMFQPQFSLNEIYFCHVYLYCVCSLVYVYFLFLYILYFSFSWMSNKEPQGHKFCQDK